MSHTRGSAGKACFYQQHPPDGAQSGGTGPQVCVCACNPETSQRELLAALYLSASMMMNSEFVPDGGKNSVRFEGEGHEQTSLLHLSIYS